MYKVLSWLWRHSLAATIILCLSGYYIALAQTTLGGWSAITTLFTPIETDVDLCWHLDGAAEIVKRVDLRRTRFEDGVVETVVPVPRSTWFANTTDPTMPYCAHIPRLKRQGHYVYEMRLCTNHYQTGAELCSEWGSSLTTGAVNGEAKPFWHYGWAPVPKSPTVN